MELTAEAAKMITSLVEQGDHPAGAGLRIGQRDDHPALAMSVADAPSAEDVVVTSRDAAVFLAPIARARLEGETLDARHGELGPAFFLKP